MGTITRGTTYGSTETITNAKLHLLVDAATVTGIVNADVSAGANIDSSKINLASSGYLTTGANFTITGVYTFTTSPVFSSVDINGGTIDGVVVGTIDINGGTMDGVQIGGTTATGELIVNNASDAADGLGVQGSSGQYLKSNGAGVNPSWATPSSGLSNVVASTPRELRASADTEESVGSPWTWEKAKEFTISRAGTYHTSYYNKSGHSSSVYTRIRKNGAVYGTERTHTGTVYAEYTQDLAFAVGDTCELWGKDSPENVCYVKDFRLYTQNEYVSTISD